jgi:hypothetical protein
MEDNAVEIWEYASGNCRTYVFRDGHCEDRRLCSSERLAREWAEENYPELKVTFYEYDNS